jgi:uncharacterized delta-60 repeat protein
MNTAHIPRLASAALLLALAACGGGGDAQPPPPAPVPAGTPIGPAGGTVTIGGATLTIPAGALSRSMIITATSSSSTAGLPEAATIEGLVFDFGPNGTTFTSPVTLTLPLPTAPAANERAVISYLDPATNQWVNLYSTVSAGQISAQVSHFTSFAARAGVELAHAPKRYWHFTAWSGTYDYDYGSGGGPSLFGEQTVGEVRVPFLFGAADPVFEQDNGASPGLAMGEVFSSASGESFSAEVEAPSGDPSIPGSRSGGLAWLNQFQSFVKRTPGATMQLVVSSAFLAASDHNGRPLPVECRGNQLALLTDEQIVAFCWPIYTGVEFYAAAFRGPIVGKETYFFKVRAFAEMYGFSGKWKPSAHTSGISTVPLWTEANFVATDTDGLDPLFALREPLVINVDLSSVDVCPVDTPAIFCTDKAFTLHSFVNAIAGNLRGRESGAAAYIRDPQKFGGAELRITGLEPTDNPLPLPTVVVDTPVPCSTGTDAAAGVLQFSAATYATPEEMPFAQGILVTRSQGSKGAVSVDVGTSDGSGIAGVDYDAVNTIVRFADGDTTPRSIQIPTRGNSLDEPDKTVGLALSRAGGCAAIGDQSTAVMTIADDEGPLEPAEYTIGGTVTGLVGTGLVLQDLHAVPVVVGNGPFTFTLPTRSGSPYEVTVLTQPVDPIQLCIVTDASGVVADADVTNVAVSCVAPPASGALDSTFGVGGRVATASGGVQTAMALQPDGTIVMAGGSASDFTLAQYSTDGALIRTISTDIAGGADRAYGVAIQPDGKIVLVGKARVNGTDDFALVRYSADGVIDATFGAQGRVTTDFNGTVDEAHGVVIQPDGKIVVVGQTSLPSQGGTDFAVARFGSNGEIDSTFSADGKLTVDIALRTDLGRNVVLQGTDILGSGLITTPTSPVLGHAGLARFDTNGALDSGFGAGGKLVLANTALGEAMILQPDGRILVGGNAAAGGLTQFALMRLEANGGIDGSFGGGLVLTPISAQGDFGYALALDTDGRVLLAGQSSNQANQDFAVARYTTGGALDTSFDSDGILTVDFFASFDGAENVAVQSGGKIVVSGYARNGATLGYGLLRINP